MSQIGEIKKLSDTRFLNFYEFEAVHRDGTSAPYFVASRAKKIEQLKAAGINDITLVVGYKKEYFFYLADKYGGDIVVNREYAGMTPAGMTFGELASCTGGGVQTPGYMGHGRHFISSKKFIHAEGGIERIVWMPKELKDDIAERLNKTAKELYGIDNFSDMIADETICTDCDELMNFLTEKNHPVLGMEPLM